MAHAARGGVSRHRGHAGRVARALCALVAGLGALAAGCAGTSLEPAGNLEARVTVVDAEDAADGKVAVAVQFLEAGQLVQVTAAVSCDEVPLRWNGLAYGARVARASAGMALTVAHERDGARTSLRVAVPPRPVVTAPTSGAELSRASATQVTYQAGGGASVRLTAIGPAGSAQSAALPDDGMASVESLGVGAGTGALVLSRELRRDLTSTGFAAASTAYTIDTLVPVVWR